MGFYELEVPFTQRVVDLGNASERAALLELWPMGKFPVLRDERRAVTLPETSVILEYVSREYGRGTSLLPTDADRARDCRLKDRFFDLYVNVPMGKIVTDKLRPTGEADAYGVARAKDELEAAYGVADDWMRESTWAIGDAFTMADCAAAPALFYAQQVLPWGERYPHLAAYYARLAVRPSFARVLAEAEPYLSLFPG